MKTLSIILLIFSFHFVYGQAGNKDSTFGTSGVGQNAFPSSTANSIAIQTDGKIVAGGGSGGSSQFGIVRYKTNGSLDSSFGSDGKVSIPVGFGSSFLVGLKIQPDGKIVCGGECHDSNGKWCFGIIRLNTDGNLDNTFNGTGEVIVSAGDLYDYCTSIALQPDGKIIAVAQSRSSGPVIVQFGTVRVNSNGTIDNSFGTGGKVMTPIGNLVAAASCVTVQPDGKILVGGISGLGAGPPNSFALIRYNSNGTLDNTFGIGGKDTTFFGAGGSIGLSADDDEANSIILQPDGKIIVTGYSDLGTDTLPPIAMLRYNADGSLDNSFGVNGKVRTFLPHGFSAIVHSVILQQNNKIILAGGSGQPSIGRAYFLLARYNVTGILDSTFGVNGIVIDSIDNAIDIIYCSVVEQDGKIVVGGVSTIFGFTVARYISGLIVGVPPLTQPNNGLLIYPNPVDCNLHVHYLNEGEKPTAINIFDLTGKLVLQKDCTDFNGDTDIDVATLPQGMYFVKVGSSVKKFVKE